MSAKSYPAEPITPRGIYHFLKGDQPLWAYRSYDGGIVFRISGPLAPIPGPHGGEGVVVTRDSLRGLLPTWSTLDQSGANQDGVTFNDAVYEPIVVDAGCSIHGRTPQRTLSVERDWIAASDAKKQGTLSVLTPGPGGNLWWGAARWFKTPMEPLAASRSRKQKFTWTVRLDDAFWRSIDSVCSFGFGYESMVDTFKVDHFGQGGYDLGPNWPQRYDGDGGGYCYSRGGSAIWRDDPNDHFTTHSREVVNGPYKDFSTATDNQVVSMVIGSTPELSTTSGADDLWARMGRNVDGTWNGNGIRARITLGAVKLSAFVAFTEVWDRLVLAGTPEHPGLIAPVPGDTFTLIAGYAGDPRRFRITHNGATGLSHKEVGTASTLGSTHRGVGFGMRAGTALITQATPGRIRKVSAGDNATVTQSGFLQLTNIGDQDGKHRFLVTGPGTFSIANAPGSSSMVKFGPLFDGQKVLLNTDPRLPSVVDLTPSTVTVPSQALNPFQQVLKALTSFAVGRNLPPLLADFESAFGISPPQGELFSLLNGRFNGTIPAKPTGGPAVASKIAVTIENGNANSAVVAALTPFRRWPL